MLLVNGYNFLGDTLSNYAVFFRTFVTIIGVMEDKGLLLGSMKFAGAGGRWSGDKSVGIEKSSISLLSTIPVEGESTPPPKG